MDYWRNDYYSLTGPLMAWVAFIILSPIPLIEGVISLGVMSPVGVGLVRTIGLFCMLGLGPLAIFAEIAPPFVTRKEVARRNRNADKLFGVDVVWEEKPFLPPVLNRLRPSPGKGERDDKEKAAQYSSRAPA